MTEVYNDRLSQDIRNIAKPEKQGEMFIEWDNQQKKWIYVGKIPESLDRKDKEWINWEKSSGM